MRKRAGDPAALDLLRQSYQVLLGALLQMLQLFVSCCWNTRHCGQTKCLSATDILPLFWQVSPARQFFFPFPIMGEKGRNNLVENRNYMQKLLYCSRMTRLLYGKPKENY